MNPIVISLIMGLCGQAFTGKSLEENWKALSRADQKLLINEFEKRTGISTEALNSQLIDPNIRVVVEKASVVQCILDSSNELERLISEINSLLKDSTEIKKVAPEDSTLGTQDDHSSSS